MKKSLAPALLLLLWGCAPPDGTPNPNTTKSPVAVSNTTLPATPSPSASPTEVAAAARLPEPDLPEKLLKSYHSIGLEPKLKESETWWAD